jgi:uncharacterized protein
MNIYKILSLDGGGAWSIIQLKALQKISNDCSKQGEEDDARKFLSRFQLIIANSGGSFALSALLRYGTFTQAIEEFSKEETRKKIFVEPPASKPGILQFKEWILRNKVKGPRYNTSKKRTGIHDVLDIWNAPLTSIPHNAGWVNSEGQATTHIVICAFDYERERAVFFRSDETSKANSHIIAGRGNFKDITLGDAVHCASNAPVQFFDKPARATFTERSSNNTSEGKFWDGAVGGYNNPSLAGITEALANGIELGNIRLLSIGTANAFLPLKSPDGIPSVNEKFYANHEKDEKLETAIKMTGTSVIAEPPDASSYTSYILLGGNQYIRMNPLIRPELNNARWDYPAIYREKKNHFDKILVMEMDAWRKQDFTFIIELADHWLNNQIPNQPIRSDSKLDPLLGHGDFKGAMAGLKIWI